MVKEFRRKNFNGGNCDQATDNAKNPRVYFMAVLFFGIASVMFCRLYFLQVSAYDSFRELSDNQHYLFKNLAPKRGEIYLKERDALFPVAVNRETKMLYAVPKEIEDASGASQSLSAALGLDREELEKKLGKKDDMYEVLKHRLSEDEIDSIKKLNLKGVRLSEETFRYYPAGDLAAHLLGFVGWKDDQFGGRYGSELLFEDRLKGEKGKLFQNSDGSGRWIATGLKEISYAKDGDNFVLSIDHIVQYQTEKILKAAIEKFEANRGTIIVMESKTGKILSMANYPAFNPNDYAKIDNMEVFRNLAVSDSYECGSVFKTFTMAAALDSGKINSQTTYFDTGSVSEAGHEIKNSDSKAHGKQTMTQVLENSYNTGVIFAEKQVGNRDFYEYLKKFGFGSPTGADFYGEAGGKLTNLKNLKSNIEYYTASFGQGITVTPLQLIAAYNAIANDGVLLKPQIIERIIHGDGTMTEMAPEEVRRVISSAAAHETSQMLRSVVVNGHGKRADVPGYLVGGKTGTAQVADRNAKGYDINNSIGSFAGFAPINDPRFTVLIRLDDPKAVEWAESSAAPTFGELMKFLLEYYHIEPTEKYSQEDLDKFDQSHDLGSYFVKKEDGEKKGEIAGESAVNNSTTLEIKKDARKEKRKK